MVVIGMAPLSREPMRNRPAAPTSQLPATQRRLYGNLPVGGSQVPSAWYRLLDNQPLHRRRGLPHQFELETPFSYVASHVESSNSTGSAKRR